MRNCKNVVCVMINNCAHVCVWRYKCDNPHRHTHLHQGMMNFCVSTISLSLSSSTTRMIYVFQFSCNHSRYKSLYGTTEFISSRRAFSRVIFNEDKQPDTEPDSFNFIIQMELNRKIYFVPFQFFLLA